MSMLMSDFSLMLFWSGGMRGGADLWVGWSSGCGVRLWVRGGAGGRGRLLSWWVLVALSGAHRILVVVWM